MSKLQEITEDLAELSLLLSSAKRTRVKDLLSIEIRRLNTLKSAASNDIPVPTSTSTTAKKPDNAPTRFTTEISNYGWDQSDKFVKIFVSLAGVQNVPEANIKLDCSGHSVELIVEDLDKKDHKLVLKNLLETVDGEKSYHKLKTDMVVLFMKKTKEGKKWDFLTKTAKKVEHIKKEETNSMMDGDNPNAALMNIMKKMYESGDASTKQMIEKAYTENMSKSSQI